MTLCVQQLKIKEKRSSSNLGCNDALVQLMPLFSQFLNSPIFICLSFIYLFVFVLALSVTRCHTERRGWVLRVERCLTAPGKGCCSRFGDLSSNTDTHCNPWISAPDGLPDPKVRHPSRCHRTGFLHDVFYWCRRELFPYTHRYTHTGSSSRPALLATGWNPNGRFVLSPLPLRRPFASPELKMAV